jgi:LysM repeat protein
MEKPDSNNQPQQTGGLKLMTVFIAVLALHVLVIGGITVYHLMGSGSDADLTQDKTHKLKADGTPIADATTPDAAAGDKTADATTASTDTATSSGSAATTTASASAPTPDVASGAVATAASTTSAPAQAGAPTVATTAAGPASATPAPTDAAAPTAASSSPIVLSKADMSQASTIPPALLPPPDASAVAPSSVAPSDDALAQAPAPAPLAATVPSGPVRMPANTSKATQAATFASSPDHAAPATHEEHSSVASHEAKHELYTVKITDSFKKIAHAHHITVAELKAANHIKGDVVLRTGQKLIIPESKTSLAKGEASHDSGSPGETASLSSTGMTHHHLYTVAKGDTLRKIAKKFNVTASAIEEANSLPDNKVTVGEKLRIPSREARSTASSTPAHEPSTAVTAEPEASVISAPAPAYSPAPVSTPPAMAPSQVETQPAPVMQPAPAPAPEPEPSAASNPELANLTF